MSLVKGVSVVETELEVLEQELLAKGLFIKGHILDS